MTDSIHPDSRIGEVHLTVSDVQRSVEFYEHALGFRLHRREAGAARLGAGGPDLLVLHEQPGARKAHGATGLYHFAVLVPSRLDLAQSLRRIAETRTPVEGFADHLVSEAIYLPDPDGNGIEIYRDRPRAEWPMHNGQLQMATNPLDVDGVFAELEAGGERSPGGRAEAWAGLSPQTTIGHIHLHVARLAEAEEFYVHVLGFDLIQRYGPSALFVSAGGYHHHIGLNTWAGVGAPPPAPGSVGLRHFVVRLPDRAELERLAGRVHTAGLSAEERDGGLFVRDPSQNGVLFAAGAAHA